MSQATKLKAVALVIVLMLLWKQSPDPGPVPPDPNPPNPVVDPSPIPDEGFRVLVLRETGVTLPSGLQSELESVNTLKYLDEHCVKVNGKAEWRYWDDDQDVSMDTPVMQKMRAVVTSTERPWIVVANGKTGASKKLEPGELMELLKKHGG